MKLIQRIRDSRTGRIVFTYLLLNICFEIAQPTVSLALTSGPSQPEVQSFEPVGTTDMVDVFTGDFNYNIPLMNIPGPNGGYPVNMAYHAGVSMDDEASWVGLGWNINNGALVRNVRGLPDDFNSEIDAKGDFASGDFIERKVDQKPSMTGGISFGLENSSVEILGAELTQPGTSFNIQFNNYRGLGYNINYGVPHGENSPFSLGLSLDSDDGLGVNVSYSFNCLNGREIENHKAKVGFNGNSGLSASLSKEKHKKTNVSDKSGYSGSSTRTVNVNTSSPNRSSSLSYANSVFSPAIGNKVNSYSLGMRFLSGKSGMGYFQSKQMSLTFFTEDFDDELKEGKRYPVQGYEKMGANNSEFYTKDFTRQNDGMITRNTPVLGHSYYTNDAYNFTGQGIGGFFRGRRSDIGRIHDPKLTNNVFGFNGSLEFTWPSNLLEIIQNPGDTPVLIATTGKKLGIGLDFTFGWNSQGAWNVNNDEKLNFDYPYGTGGKNENFYYQVHGQPTVLATNEMDHINNETIYRPKLKHVGMERGIDNETALKDRRQNTDRVVRNTLVHNFQNSEIGKLPEFNEVYHDYTQLTSDGKGSNVMLNSLTPQSFNRSSRKLNATDENEAGVSIKGHAAGYKVLNEDGSYYVYGLPAYNNKEVNNLFSANVSIGLDETEPQTFGNDGSEVTYKHANTDKFIHKTTQSPYAHSFMLTAIYGADYVDITQDGPTNDDLGYWVKFDYVKYAADYKWRAPYSGAFLNKGAHHTTEDDKMSYAYGEKEVWYLGKIETKTHVAVYHLSERHDIAESNGEFSSASTPNAGNKTGLKIDGIGLYVKADYIANGLSAKPLQEVHFRYDYSSCPNVLNNDGEADVQIIDGQSVDVNEAKGKLTLKALWFTAQGSQKGTFNKYKFNYSSGDPADNATLQNPSYAFNSINGWGGYKPGGGANCPNKYFPYADQFNQWPAQGNQAFHNNEAIFEDATAKANFKRYQDQFASAWSLKQIELPSGGIINVDYESDDYGYVQDQEATQMFKITGVSHNGFLMNSLLYDADTDFNLPSKRRIYFKLEYPIPDVGADLEGGATKVYNKYVKDIIKDENNERNIFFKAFIQLKDIPGMSFNEECESVAGYLPLEEGAFEVGENITDYYCGLSPTLVNGHHTHGYVTVKQTKKKVGGYFNHHPVSLLAWQYMQTNTPKLMHDVASYDDGDNGNFVQQLSNLLNIVPAFMSSVGGTRLYARSREFARKIDLSRSVIRLCSPDKTKFGGGHRVRKITITDAWGTITAGESDRTYGTEYNYTMKDEDGLTDISSGVAQYEPGASGDENALKYPLHFKGKNTFISNNNLFAEHPFNEDLFPGASVGYRQVAVKSINTGKQLRNETPNTGRTGGVTVYQFYTAKEFPTIVEYTSFNGDEINDYGNDYKGVLNLALPIPLIGAYYRKYYHASQGFKIELNDMHGKPKSIESFELTANYQLVGNPITSSTYEYQTQQTIHNGNNVMRLHNKVRVVSKDNPTQLALGERDLGVEYDLFTDQRQTKSHTINAGLEINLDWPEATAPLIIPSFWPSFSTNKTLMRTYVTNKVIFKTGILKRTVTRDLQSNSSSEMVAYDELSGQPLISKGTNEFGDELYSYNMPAYWNYDRMGHAYKNINYSFSARITVLGSNAPKREVSLLVEPNTDMLDMLVRGDEVLFQKGNTSLKAYYADLTYDGSGNPKMLFYVSNVLASEFSSTYAGLIYNFENPPTAGNPAPVGRVIRSGRRNHYDAIGASYVTKGNVFDQFNGTPHDLVDGITTPKLNHVLAASATMYRDDWDHSLSVNETDGQLVSNPFLSGNSGIWRPYKSYTYAGARGKSADLAAGSVSQGPNLRTDGLMEEVPLFSWEIGNMEDYVSQWEWASEITRHNNDSYEVENIDRLGIKSAALFGLGQNLSIAVGGNAGYHEMGVMDFENTIDPQNVNNTLPFADLLGLTNLTFYKTTPPAIQQFVSETTKIKDCYRNADGSLSVFLDMKSADFNFMSYTNNRIGLGLISRKSGTNKANIGHYLNGTFDPGLVESYMDNGISKVKLKITQAGLSGGAESLQYLKTGEHFYGRGTFLIDRSGAANATVSGIDFVKKAHTGKMGMSVSSNASFLQKELLLKTGTTNKYVLSLWVSRSDANQYRFSTIGSDLITLSQVHPSTGAVTAVPAGTLKYTCSKVIEGWQKIDIIFSMDVTNGVLRLNFTPGASALYVDDIRVSPHTGGMTTNVYDPSNFRLRASLNVDNYATLYFYDEQGNLVMRKQETENGIVTLSESRGNVRKGQ